MGVPTAGKGSTIATIGITVPTLKLFCPVRQRIWENTRWQQGKCLILKHENVAESHTETEWCGFLALAALPENRWFFRRRA